MPHVPISSIVDLPCNCPPIPSCVSLVNPTASDPSIAEGEFTLPGSNTLVIPYFDITNIALTCAATPVAQVDRIAPSSFTVGDCCGNETTYTLQISQIQCETQVQPSVYEVQVTTDQTAADIVDTFTALINADPNAFVTATDNGSNFTITSDEVGCAFTVEFLTDNLVRTAVTANVVGAGQTANLLYYGVDSDLINTAATYHTLEVKYRAFKTNPIDMRALHGCEECKVPCIETCLIFVVNDSDGDAWLAAFYDISDGTATASLYLSKSGVNPAC